VSRKWFVDGQLQLAIIAHQSRLVPNNVATSYAEVVGGWLATRMWPDKLLPAREQFASCIILQNLLVLLPMSSGPIH